MTCIVYNKWKVKMIKVSIIIPVYNVEQYLRQCLDSVVNQSLKDIEIICIDDGSPDNSGKILDEYAEHDSRIKVIHKENGGYGSALNCGISLAKGEYIGVVESDDWIEHDMYEALYDGAIASDADIIKGSFFRVINSAKNIKRKNKKIIKLYKPEPFKLEENPELIDVHASLWSAIYKKDFILQNNLKVVEDVKPYEDLPFVMTAYAKAKSIYIVPKCFYNYRCDAVNSTNNAVKPSILNYVVQKSRARDILKNSGLLSGDLKEIYWKNVYYGTQDFYNKPNNKYRRKFYEAMQVFYKKAEEDNCQFEYFSKNQKRTFLAVKNKSYRRYSFEKFIGKTLHNIFSITNAKDRKHKIIILFGLKIKFSKLIDVYNIGSNKVFKFLFFKIKVNRFFALRFKDYRIQKNKIVFSNYFGKSYGCNPKYITEEILKRNLPYEIVWLVNNPERERNNFPPEIRLTKYYSKQGMKDLLTAKVWVDNTRKPAFWSSKLKKKPEQIYIQTWHGSLGMKKIEGAIKDEKPFWRKNAKIDSKNIDYLLTTSETDKKFMRESFWYDGEILVSGYPRNDILYSSEEDKQKIREKVFEFLGISLENKFILYCPTFRDDGRETCFTLNYNRVIRVFENKYRGKVVLGTRFHPYNIKFADDTIVYSDSIINATVYPDIMELLIAADVLITDYSSCIFDFMHLHKPAFIFATDIEQYKQERGFYFPLEDTPFPIAESNDALIGNIENFDNDNYVKTINEYMKENGYVDDGHASERVVDLIEKVMEQ